MVVLSTQAIIAIVCIAVAILLIFAVLLTCFICRKCDQCCRWRRRREIARDELVNEQEFTETRREFNEIRQQHDTVRDQIRAKYNLNNANSNEVVVP